MNYYYGYIESRLFIDFFWIFIIYVCAFFTFGRGMYILAYNTHFKWLNN